MKEITTKNTEHLELSMKKMLSDLEQNVFKKLKKNINKIEVIEKQLNATLTSVSASQKYVSLFWVLKNVYDNESWLNKNFR